MKTTLGQKSLVLWKQNQNKTNIYVNGGNDVHLFLKGNYLNMFKTIKDNKMITAYKKRLSGKNNNIKTITH